VVVVVPRGVVAVREERSSPGSVARPRSSPGSVVRPRSSPGSEARPPWSSVLRVVPVVDVVDVVDRVEGAAVMDRAVVGGVVRVDEVLDAGTVRPAASSSRALLGTLTGTLCAKVGLPMRPSAAGTTAAATRPAMTRMRFTGSSGVGTMLTALFLPARRFRSPPDLGTRTWPDARPGGAASVGRVITALPRSAPEDQGIPSQAIVDLVVALERDFEPHSLMVLRHGTVVAEGWWAPYSPDGVQLLYSLSKSFTSAAAGFALAEGRCGLDDLVIDHFPTAAAGPHARAMRLRHTLSMSTGHHRDSMADMDDAAEPVQRFLQYEPEEEPGSWFTYENGASYTAAAIVQQTTGERLTDYLRPRLFDPLGIEQARWARDRRGRDVGYSGLHLTTESIARFGQLLLDGGGDVLPQGWVRTATAVQTDNSGYDSGPDWRQGYGYQFWRCRHDAFRGDGAMGQYCLVLPQQDLVLVLTSCHSDMQASLDTIWDTLLPAIGDGPLPPNDAAAGELRELLRQAAVPAPVGSARADDNDFRIDSAELPGLTNMRISGETLTLVEDDTTIDLPLAADQWPVNGPFRARGGWTDEHTLELRIVAVQTPHHVLISGDAVTGRATARWNRPPLRGHRLREQIAPD
jgi:CubicO group peptidase (beta-lactamase class C family)